MKDMEKKYMRKNKKRLLCMLLALLVLACSFAACGSKESASTKESASGQTGSSETIQQTGEGEAPVLAGRTCTGQMELDYAECFDIYYYDDGSTVIDIHDEAQYLLIPEGGEVPETGAEKMKKLQMPLTKIYDAATSSLSLFSAMDALDTVRMVSMQESGWTYDSMKKAMADGSIIFAGKYNEPDYELLLQEGCQIAIESTMIKQTPDVQEMIETLGIPVMIEHSSYESNPLGRMEWIKLYGTLNGRLEDAEAFYNTQKELITGIEQFEKTDLKVAFFYISTDGKAVARRSTDYIPAMIYMAGGNYIFKDLDDESGKSSIDMGIETFFDTAKDADILIYNGSIDSTVKSLADLKSKSPVMEKIKAVQEGNVWVTGNSVYQRVDVVGDMILDFHRVITGEDLDQLQFLSRME